MKCLGVRAPDDGNPRRQVLLSAPPHIRTRITCPHKDADYLSQAIKSAPCHGGDHHLSTSKIDGNFSRVPRRTLRVEPAPLASGTAGCLSYDLSLTLLLQQHGGLELRRPISDFLAGDPFHLGGKLDRNCPGRNLERFLHVSGAALDERGGRQVLPNQLVSLVQPHLEFIDDRRCLSQGQGRVYNK